MSVVALPRVKGEKPLDIETPISISSVVQLLPVRHAALDGVRGVLVWLLKVIRFPAIYVNDSGTRLKSDNVYGCRHSPNDGIKCATQPW